MAFSPLMEESFLVYSDVTGSSFSADKNSFLANCTWYIPHLIHSVQHNQRMKESKGCWDYNSYKYVNMCSSIRLVQDCDMFTTVQQCSTSVRFFIKFAVITSGCRKLSHLHEMIHLFLFKKSVFIS